jgi:hypothetical protein
MPIRIAILSGARQGDVLLLAKSYLTIGRHPGSDIRLDPEKDLRVSSRHAAIMARDGIWLLRDLGSTNGTWVNNAPLSGQHVLASGDVIELGRGGPSFRLDLVSQEGGPAPPPPARPAERELRPTPHDGATASWPRFEAGVRRFTLRNAVAVLSALAIVLAALAGWQAMRHHALDRQQEAIVARADSLASALSRARADDSTLRNALDSAIREIRSLRESAGAARRDGEQLDLIEMRLDGIRQRVAPLLDQRSPL